MASKQLYIDGQLFQTNDWNRGMGKITVEFLLALLRQKNFNQDWRITVVLNENLRDAKRDTEVQRILGDVQVDYAKLELPSSGKSYTEVRSHNRAVLDASFGRTEDVYFIPALFAADIYPVYPTNTKKVLLFHDLIPLLFADNYLRSEQQKQYYFERFDEIFVSDLILANSDTTRDDLLRFLSISPERVVTVYGAGFDRSNQIPTRPKSLKSKKPYIFFPSGDDYRKNNTRCVEAFKLLNEQHGSKYQLVIPSNFGEGTETALQAIADNITFVGPVSDGEFRWLLQNTELVFFGTQYEGLGMPLLEAMSENVGRIVCSDIAVFHEIARNNEVEFCDPNSPAEMATALERKLSAEPRKSYPALATFTWDRTGKLFAAALEQLARQPSTRLAQKPKIAIIAPDPRGFSSIGKFVQELHPAVVTSFDVDYYFEMSELTKGLPKASFLPFVAKYYDVHEFTAQCYATYDAVWYHLGNSDYHVQTIERALVYPGYVVLHDTRLRGLYDQLVQRGYISETRYLAEESMGGLREAEFIASIVNSARGVLVHSHDAKEKAVQQLLARKHDNVVSLYHPISVGGEHRKNKRVTIGFGGFATPRADDFNFNLLQRMLADDRFRDCQFEVFGFHNDPNNVESFIGAVIDRLSSEGRVHITTNLNDLAFQNKLQDLDIIMNFRQVYSGETSRFTLESMRYGLCAVVRDVGWYHELPDEAVCKVKEPEDILEAVAQVVGNTKLRQSIQTAARLFTSTHTAEGYVSAMQRMMSDNLLNTLPQAYKRAWLSSLQGQSSVSYHKAKDFLG